MGNLVCTDSQVEPMYYDIFNVHRQPQISARLMACLHDGRVILVDGLPWQTGPKKASIYMK